MCFMGLAYIRSKVYLNVKNNICVIANLAAEPVFPVATFGDAKLNSSGK